MKYEITTEAGDEGDDRETAVVLGIEDADSEEIDFARLEIPEKIEAGGKYYPVVGIGAEAFRGCEKLAGIKLPESLKKIGNRVFYECEKLFEVALPENVSDMGDDIFCNCPAKIIVPELHSWIYTDLFVNGHEVKYKHASMLENAILMETGNSYQSGGFTLGYTEVVIEYAVKEDFFDGEGNVIIVFPYHDVPISSVNVDDEVVTGIAKDTHIAIIPVSKASGRIRLYINASDMEQLRSLALYTNDTIKYKSTDKEAAESPKTEQKSPEAVESPKTEHNGSDISEKTVTSTETCTQQGKESISLSKQVRSIKIRPVKKTIKISGNTIKVKAGKTVKLKAIVKPADAAVKEVKWKVNKPSLAAINAKGVLKVKKKAAGKKLKVTAVAKDNSRKKAVLKVKIVK